MPDATFRNPAAALPGWPFDNTYARQLHGLHVPVQPARAPAPRLLYLNTTLCDELGLDAAALQGEAGAALFSGNRLPEGAEPIAQAYAGHQFGGFSPQLGDGRALLLGELIDRHGRRRDIALKGSGRTPFSRGGDGRAAVGPMLREVVVGEAMHALGVPTTRALAVVATGEPVLRDEVLPGAVLTRVAASHLRVGTFQFFASRGEMAMLQRLLDYTVARHDPQLAGRPDAPIALLEAVARRQAALVARWLHLGFIHGVMNTDNMTISGETIDYGPCAFMEAYDPDTVFSSIDHGGRYAYGNQGAIARWNLARLAEALLPLMPGVDDDDEAAAQAAVERAVAAATAVIDAFPAWLDDALQQGWRAKLGLAGAHAAPADADRALADDFLALLHAQQADFTLAWRRLAEAAEGDANPLRALLADPAAATPWLARWQTRCAAEDAGREPAAAAAARAARLRAANPWLIPRNHRVEEALAAASGHGAAAEGSDLAPLQRLLEALRDPFTENPAFAELARPAPPAQAQGYRTFCGT